MLDAGCAAGLGGEAAVVGCKVTINSAKVPVLQQLFVELPAKNLCHVAELPYLCTQ